MKHIKLLILLTLFASLCHGQGKLLLIGGGGEVDGGWSDPPYQWGVDQSSNKKVAIISIDAGNNPQWLVDYFVKLGASSATNFEFPDRDAALSTGVYDELMSYDFIFFKGGDQWLYYSYFKNSEVDRAVMDKFLEGGVIGGTSAGMAILGEYTYTAENSSLTPWEGLEDVFSSNITIENDFIPLLSGFITDTHFLERGRMPRLNAMQANYFLENQGHINGIACDDQTAIAITEQSMAEVYGTGGAYFYFPDSFSAKGNKWSGTVNATQLSNGMRIDLTTNQLDNGPTTPSEVDQKQDGNNEVMLCGDKLTDTTSECVQFLAQKSDTLIIVTGASRITAANLLQSLSDLGKQDVIVLSAISENNDSSQWELRNTIRHSKNIVFIDNDPQLLMQFMDGGPTGNLLKDHLFRNDLSVAFFGEDAKLAGARYVTNNFEESSNAYNGALAFEDGLNLLGNSTVIPGAFDASNQNFLENNSLSGLYALANDQLYLSVYLNSRSMVRFFQQENENKVQSNGRYSAVIVMNTAANYDLFDEKAGANPRNNASFDNLTIQTLNSKDSVTVGDAFISNDVPYEFESAPEEVVTSLSNKSSEIRLLPTVSGGNFNIESKIALRIAVFSMDGQLVTNIEAKAGQSRIQLKENGLFIVRIFNQSNGSLVKSQKIVVQ